MLLVETKATYEDIKKYVAEHNNWMNGANLHIAQIKKKCGMEIGQNYNLLKSEDSKQSQCPKEKEVEIVEALKTFKYGEINKFLFHATGGVI